MKLLILVLVLLSLLGCSSHNSKLLDLYNPETCTYTNKDMGFTFTLPCERGWIVTPLDLKGEESHMLLTAIHQGKLVDVIVTCEPINADLEDYLFLIKSQLKKKYSNDPSQSWSYQEIEVTPVQVNEIDAIKYVYESNLNTKEFGRKLYVFVNILVKNREFNYRLLIYTPAEAYTRKVKYIDKVINGFNVIK
jgi:hypothetical protein